MAGKYEVDYNDSRLVSVKNEQAQKESEIKNRYDTLANESKIYYDKQIENSKNWAEKQTELQNNSLNQTLTEIQQNKDQTEKNYMKEQKGAYADYQKQINPYSVRAEQMAANGLSNSGFSENERINKYLAYQNRYTSAREDLNKALININNSIVQARNANDARIAEIAEKAMDEQLSLSLQAFNYRSTLMQEKEQRIAENTDRYNSQYQNVLAQINQEIENQKWWDNFNYEREQNEKEYNLKMQEFALKKREAEKQMEYITAQINALNKKSSSSSKNFSSSGTSAQNKLYRSLLSSVSKMSGISGRNLIASKYNSGQITKEQAEKLYSIAQNRI